MNFPIKIIVADDHPFFLSGIRLLFKNEKNFELLDEISNGKDLLDLLHSNQPDIVLLDLNMPVMNGFDSIKYIKQSYPHIKIIILSTYNEEHLIEKVKNLGANGYLLKTTDKNELLSSIHLVANGHTCFPNRQPLKQTDNISDNFLRQLNLTKRELEIISAIKNEQTNQQIANELHLSVYTIETHRKNIMHKLKLKNPGALMKFILENNL